MSKLEKYTSYKDSGVEWLGEIPEGWEVKRVKHLLKIHNGQDYKHVLSDEGYPVIGSGGQFAYANQYIYDGEVLLLGRKGTIDKPLYFKGKFWTVDTMFYGVPKKTCNLKFLYYSSLSIPFNFYSTSTALPSMTQFDLNNHKVTIPPKAEQTKIASFLDDKTSQIDKAISQKEKLIELLKERRQITINEAVTKGLDKDVEFKDSGVEWIGEIPKHWEVIKFKHLFYEKKKTHDISLNCGSISFGKVVEKDDEKIPVSTKASYQVLNKGEFLINPLNLNYDLKSLRIGLSDLDVVVSSGYIIIKNREIMNKTYFNWLLHRYDIAFMKTLGAGVRQTLNYHDIGETLLVNPPRVEQDKIAEYIETQTAKIDKAIELQQNYIIKLKEYKASLIEATVTGKVRVA